MRFWQYVEPGDDGEPVFHTLSEAEILTQYFAWWGKQMLRVNKADQLSFRACIEDWVVVHWAWEVPTRDTPNPAPPD